MSRTLALLLIAATYAAEVLVGLWHLLPNRKPVFS